MFGISWAEFLVILLIAVIFIPVRMWPEVARLLAKAVNFVRKILWQLTDASEKIKQQIELEKPIEDLIHTTTDDVLAEFSTSIKKKPVKPKKVRKNK